MKELKLHIKPLKEWISIGKTPLIISGPCSAESSEQLLKTAQALKQTGFVKIFRSGLWKPRTRPDLFEGVGEKGLKWVKNVKEKTELLTCVEVATPKHVDLCVNAGVDILWIGARTAANPFSIQEIADALKGKDIPVMIKNPINPDLKLWIGAIERINKAGIKKIIAIHRGFNSYDSTPYRNAPIWEIPIELMRICPKLPVICDPSHISGNTYLLEQIAQKALDLEMDGFMIESHYNPKLALSDKEQQITPAELSKLVKKLIIRKHSTNDKELINKLEELRFEIDKIDVKLIQFLSKRMKLVEQIGYYKKENNITILQLKRWNSIIKESLTMGEKLGLKKEFLLKFLHAIHEESIQKQTDIFKNKT